MSHVSSANARQTWTGRLDNVFVGQRSTFFEYQCTFVQPDGSDMGHGSREWRGKLLSGFETLEANKKLMVETHIDPLQQ